MSDRRLVMEREYVIGDGDNIHEFSSTLGLVLNAACSQLQGIQLVRGARSERAGLSQVAPLTTTGDAQFDRGWVMTQSESVPADRAPSAPVRAALQGSPRGESWYFWDGWACCTFDGCLDATNTATFLAHIDDVVASISPKPA